MERSFSNRRDTNRLTPRNLDQAKASGRLTPSTVKKSNSSFSASSPHEQMFQDSLDKEDKFKHGMHVIAQDKKGIVRFVGETQFSTGKWLGIELFEPSGKNDGSVQGIRYFNAKVNQGLFVRPSQAKIDDSGSNVMQNTPESSRNSINPRIPSSNSDNPLKTKELELKRLSSISHKPRHMLSPSSNTALASKLTNISTSRSNSPLVKSTSKFTFETPLLKPSISSSKITPINNENHSDTFDGNNLKTSLVKEKVIAPAVDLSAPININNETSAQLDSSRKLSILDETWRPVLSMDQSMIFDTTPRLIKSDQTVPLAKYEELKSKVKFLEQKRAEERALILEAEDMKSKYGQTARAQEKLVEKLKLLKQEHQEMSSLYTKAQEQVSNIESLLYEERETLELVAVEKEMAEEQIEGYKQDSAILKEQIEELQDKINLYEGTEPQNSDGSNSVELAQLRSKNFRLVEALRLLRDEKEDETQLLKNQIKDMEKDVTQGKKASEQLEKQSSEIKQLLAVIGELKQRLEDAGDAEDLISELSDRNSRLNDRVGDLESQVEHWQSMYEVSEEMYEGSTEEIKALNTELGRLEWEVQDRDQQILTLRSTINENSSIIAKFREAVSQLKQEREKAEEKQQEMQSYVQETEEATKNLEKLAYNAGRANQVVTSREIELDLQRLETSQLLLHLNIIKTYLPQEIPKDDNDSISCLLSLQSISFKADLICKNFEGTNKNSDIPSKELYFAAQARLMLVSIARIADIIATSLSNCSQAEFIKIGFILKDVVEAENRINELVEQARKSETSFVSTIEISKISLQILSRLEEKIIIDNKSSLIQPRMKLYVFEIGYRIDEVQCTLFLLAQKSPFIGIAAKDIIDISREVKVYIVKIQFKIEEYKQKNMSIKEDNFANFYDILVNMKKISQFFESLWTSLPDSFIENVHSLNEDNQDSHIQDILINISNKIFGESDEEPLSSVSKAFLELLESLKIAYNICTDNANFETLAAVTSPWETKLKENALSLKNNEETIHELSKTKQEVLDIAKRIKQKEQQVEEMKMHIMVLDKRAMKVKELESKNTEIDYELNKKQSINEELEKLIESLHSEIDILKAKKDKQNSSKPDLLAESLLVDTAGLKKNSVSVNGEPNSNLLNKINQLSGPMGVIQENDRSLLGELRACRNSLKLAKMESMNLKGISVLNNYKKNKKDEGSLTEGLTLKSKLLTTDFTSNNLELHTAKKIKKSETFKYISEAKGLITDALLLAAAPKLVRLNPSFQSKSENPSSGSSYYTNSNSSHWEILGLERALAVKATELSLKLF
ncbi:hypothetical protein BB561_003606 [Smittium simulii]|uniref:CAP-Gly domain-containing protein n=1 Tax=Smittium simulii TaxID=133385 RepID=A0A2T9YKD8_9FUNG|nr:hypothetical protein BB561_003606 [Smittium simulii]